MRCNRKIIEVNGWSYDSGIENIKSRFNNNNPWY